MGKIKLKTKKDDFVSIITGKDRGKRGKVLRVFPKEQKVIVEKINMVKRHTKPRKMGEPSGIIEKEAKIHISNVMPICTRCDKPVRIGIKQLAEGDKVRCCKSCGDPIDRI
jgi:large subunit ribosomal protein L24